MIKRIIICLLPIAIAIMILRTSAGLSTEFNLYHFMQAISDTNFVDFVEFTDAWESAAESFDFVSIKDIGDFFENIGIFFESIWHFIEAIGTLLKIIFTNIIKVFELIYNFITK